MAAIIRTLLTAAAWVGSIWLIGGMVMAVAQIRAQVDLDRSFHEAQVEVHRINAELEMAVESDLERLRRR